MTDVTPDLHLFYLCDCDYVAATDIDDAWAAYCEETGNKRGDFDDAGTAIADDKRIAVAEHEGRGAPKTTKTAREWAQRSGRGLAFSTEY